MHNVGKIVGELAQIGHGSSLAWGACVAQVKWHVCMRCLDDESEMITVVALIQQKQQS